MVVALVWFPCLFPSSALPYVPASSPDLSQQGPGFSLTQENRGCPREQRTENLSQRFSLKCEEMLLEVVRDLTASPHKSLVPVGLGPIPRPIPVMGEAPCT